MRKNPWDPIPIPTHADPIDSATYEGVGRVISQWESVEFQLSRLYSAFVGDSDGPPIQQYGVGRIFKERLAILERSAQQWFISQPSQHAEGHFDRIVEQVRGFADRRNEVAHGIVFPVHTVSFFMETMKLPSGNEWWALVPPYHLLRKHDERGAPTYVYTRAELFTLAATLTKVISVIGAFNKFVAGVNVSKRY